MSRWLGCSLAGLCLIGSARADLSAAWQDVGYLDYRRAKPQFEQRRRGAAPDSDEWRQATLGHENNIYLRD